MAIKGKVGFCKSKRTMNLRVRRGLSVFSSFFLFFVFVSSFISFVLFLPLL